MNISNLFRKSSILLLLRGSSLALTLAISLFIANAYGASSTGIYYLFISLITGLSIISKFGFESSLIKYISQHDNKKAEANPIRALWTYALKVSIFISIMLIIVLMISSMTKLITYIPALDESIIIYSILCLIPFSLFGVNIAAMRGLENLISASFFESLLFPTILIISLIFLYINNINEGILISYTFTSFVLLIISAFFLIIKIPKASYTVPINKDDLLGTCKPILGINLLNFISNWGVTFILAIYVSLQDIGIYNIAWRIITITSIFTLVLNNINAPTYSKEYKIGNITKIEQHSRTTCMLLTIIGLPIIISITLFSNEILGLFGNDFIEGTLALQILAFGQFITFVTGSVGYLLMMTGHEKNLRNITFYVSFIQIALYLIFIPKYGITAAAIITSCAIASKNLLAVFSAYKHIGIISLPLPYKWLTIK